MSPRFASALLIIALVSAIVPPGYAAYIGAYAALTAALCGIVLAIATDRQVFLLPSISTNLAGLLLVIISVPLIFRGSQDLLAPVILAPVLACAGVAALARRARFRLNMAQFASMCLCAAVLALGGGLVERLLLDVARPGLGNNPIHYASLAVMTGSLAMCGMAAAQGFRRFVFLLGPACGLAAAVLSGSRGPLAAGVVTTVVGLALLSAWNWRERVFRVAVLGFIVSSAAALSIVLTTDHSRIARLLTGAFDIFRMTGGKDDIRAALYASAVEVLHRSPLAGAGYGQLMETAETMFPDLVPRYNLENLHADWANMAAMAGGLGLAAYVIILFSPVLILFSPASGKNRPIVLGVVTLVLGQLLLGISNATFGVLPQTTLFAVTLGFLVAQAMPQKENPS